MKKVTPKTARRPPGGKKGPQRTAAAPRVPRSSRENDSLIRAIHHRVVNQLNLIYNILYFQKQFSRESRCAAMLAGNQRRVKAIALVYEHIDRAGDFDRVRFAGYCKSLLTEILGPAGARGKKIALRTRIAPVNLDVATAVTCGLIINELLANALEHAFPGDRPGEIRFGLQERKDGALAITVSDDGVGLPPEVQWQRGGAMGGFLVNTLCESLKGEFTVDVNEGTSFQLSFHPPQAAGR